MPVMQRKSIGHRRRKQGEQAALDCNKRFVDTAGKPGPVNSGEVLPKIATTGVPTAAATCIGPVSLVSRRRQPLSKAQSSGSDVRAARLTGAWRGWRAGSRV